jgi:hypothetical protein
MVVLELRHIPKSHDAMADILVDHAAIVGDGGPGCTWEQ